MFFRNDSSLKEISKNVVIDKFYDLLTVKKKISIRNLKDI